MAKCAVLNCRKSRYRASKTNVELIIHSFPQQDDLYRSWVQFCRQSENWKPSGYFGICSFHFKNDDYQMDNTPFKGSRKRSRILFPNAIPSIFESPPLSECIKKEQDKPLRITTNIKIEPIYTDTEQDEKLYTDSDVSHEPDSVIQKYREQFCRTCLNHCKDAPSISVDSQIQNMTVLDMLIQLTAFETEHNDAFPTVICLVCKDKLEHAFNIRQEFIAQSEHLVQLVAEEKIIDFFHKVSVESGGFIESVANEDTINEMYDACSNDVPIKEENETEEKLEDFDLNDGANCFTDFAVAKSDDTEEMCVRSSKVENEIAETPKNSEQKVPRTRKKAPGRKMRKKVSWENVSLTSEEARKRKAEVLRERARGYSLASNRKRYKLEAEAQNRYPFTTCYICDKKHASLMERDLHMQEHIPMLPYECRECSSTTENDESQPAEDMAKDKSTVLKTINQLNAHLRMHNMPHKCDKCYRRFCTSLKLKTHYWSSHGIAENGLTCEYCGKQYFQRTIFTRHVAYHRNEINGQFKCTICDRSMGSKGSLRRHEASHNGEKKFQCMYCEKSFSTSYNRLTHQRVVHTGERPYKCKDCGRGFVDNTRLKIHQEIHEKLEKGAKDVIRKSNLLAPGKDICPYPGCDFTAITYRAMYVHKRKTHMSVYRCEVCSRSFAFEYDFKSHLLLHTGEKPYKCEICDRSFRRVAMYRRHLQTHVASNAIPSYNCGICQKSFKMARYLQAHILTHSSERNFACETCRSSFKTKGELKRHRKYKHGIEISEAIIVKAGDAETEDYYITEVIE